MKQFLRFALILGDSNSTTFNSNLLKLIKLELSDTDANGLSIQEIIEKIHLNYDLQFTEDEILKSINSDKINSILKIKIRDEKYSRYVLNPDHMEKYKKKTENALINIVSDFMTQNIKYNTYELDYAITLITNFIYNAFNEDKQTFLSYMNYKSDTTKVVAYYKFDDSQKQFLFDFLTWENKEKDNYIYNSVSSCYEYCLLTIKKDNKDFLQVFNKKVFYLDSNILFRYILFENHEQNKMVKLFVEKCKHAGIELKYTNCTKAEILYTINKHVKDLKNLFGNTLPISTEAIKTLNPEFKNYDFYEQYSTWKKMNQKQSFIDFQSYLEKKMLSGLSQFKYESFENYDSKNTKKEFNHLLEDLTEYKIQNGKTPSDEPIKHDVNMYMFLREKNSDCEKNSFLNVKNYFITFDNVLVNWTAKINKGDIPTFVLPSVWYSTLLKYKGRTDNDFEAFCKFLSFTTGADEIKNEQSKTREKILIKIISLNESSNYKEELIFNIDKKLREGNIEIDDVDEFVLQEQNSFVKQKVELALKEANEQHNKEINDIKVQSDNIEKSSFSKGFEAGKEEIYDKEVERILRRNKHIRNISFVFLILTLLVLLVSLTIILFSDKFDDFFKEKADKAVIPDLMATILSVIIRIVFKKTNIFSLDQDAIKDKIINKYK